MPTECTPTLFAFEAVERKAVVACFDGGTITSNGGALLLGQVDRPWPGASVRRLLYRPARSALCRAPRCDACGAAHLRAGGGLRGPQRSRRIAQGSDACGVGGQIEPGFAVGLRGACWQEHAQPHRAHAETARREIS